MESKEHSLFSKAFFLSIFTIVYNLIEGVVSTFLGYKDETLTLFGFGVDSFIEIISGLGIAVMIIRMRNHPQINKTGFEITALRITGTSFYILTVGLLAGIVLNLVYRHTPETTFWGVIISLVSIVTMLWLMNAKMKIGKKLQSEPIVADAKCTRICLYMSGVLLISSLIYEITGFTYADIIGAAGLMYFSFSEGKESFEKAKNKNCTCFHC